MHILLYEWATGGGLVEEVGLPDSLFAEGLAMVGAVAADFARLDGCRVSVLRDLRMEAPLPPGCEVVEVHGYQQAREQLESLARLADHALVIAPEFDGILVKTVARLRRQGVATLNASDEFLRAASDKQATAQLLAAAGVPVPEAVLAPADAEKLPRDFPYPGVLKPLDGAGSQHTLLVEDARDEPPPYPWPRRLERYCPGRAASVLLCCGPHGFQPLPPCWQRLSGDGRFKYLGGATIQEPELAARAIRLGAWALAALPPANGYVGVDLVLGDAADGAQDVVIEVNPRLTTSYVGVRAAVAENLAQALLQAMSGPPRPFTRHGAGVEFTSAGFVRRLNA